MREQHTDRHTYIQTYRQRDRQTELKYYIRYFGRPEKVDAYTVLLWNCASNKRVPWLQKGSYCKCFMDVFVSILQHSMDSMTKIMFVTFFSSSNEVEY